MARRARNHCAAAVLPSPFPLKNRAEREMELLRHSRWHGISDNLVLALDMAPGTLPN